MLTLGVVCSVDVDKHMMTCIHHYGTIWSILTALKLLLCWRNFFQNENTHIINIQIKKQLYYGHLTIGNCSFDFQFHRFIFFCFFPIYHWTCRIGALYRCSFESFLSFFSFTEVFVLFILLPVVGVCLFSLL